MTPETAQALADMQRRSQAAQAAQAERRQRLIAEYGQDVYDRSDVLIFRPSKNDQDQESRAAVKIGSNRWTLSARGNSHAWVEVLELVGSGKVLTRVASETGIRPAFSVEVLETKTVPNA